MRRFNQAGFLLLSCLMIHVISAKDAEHYVDGIRQNFHNRTNSRLSQQIFRFSKNVLIYKGYASYFQRADKDLPGFRKFFMEKSEFSQKQADGLTTFVNKRGGHVNFYDIHFGKICHEEDWTSTLGRFPHTCEAVLRKDKINTKYFSGVRKKAGYNPYKPTKKHITPVIYSLELRTVCQRQGPHTAMVKGIPTALMAIQESLGLEKVVHETLLDVIGVIIRFHDPSTRVLLEDYLDDQLDIVERLGELETRLQSFKDKESEALGEYILDSELVYQ